MVATTVLFLMAVGPDAAVLPPKTPWSVEYADNMCVLSRDFGRVGQQVEATLALRPLPLSQRAEMIFVGGPADAPTPQHGRIAITLLPSGDRQAVAYARLKAGPAGRSGVSFDVPSVFLDKMRSADAMTVAIGRAAPVRLETGAAAKAFAALTPCQDDLLRHWGYDPTIKDRIATPAATLNGSPGAWFERGYYPPEAVRESQEGRVTIAWTIRADGKTSDCRVLGSSGVRSLDLTTCAIILQKARFKPALDASGKPLATYQTLSVRWSLDS